jgi:malate permease and related proteins
MATMLAAIIPVFLVAAVGFGLRRFILLDGKTLAAINLYVLLPALVYSRISAHAIDWPLFLAVAMAAVLMVVAMTALMTALGRLMRLDSGAMSAFLMTQFMNLGNFGLPVALFAFGEEGLALAVIVMVCGSFLQNSLGLYFAQRSTHSALNAATRVFRFPVIYALALALLSQRTHIYLIEPVRRGVDLMGDAAVPIQLMILGIQLAETRLETSPLVMVAAACRLLLGPVVALLIVWIVGLHGLPAKVFILLMSGPVAVTMAAYSVQFNVSPRFLASVVSWTFLLSLFSVALVLYTLERFPALTGS